MTTLFTYGSLMFDDVWSRVVRGHYTKSAAILRGYALHRLRNETFPAIIHAGSNARVSGWLYSGIDDIDLARLDAFEGDYYRRERIAVLCDGKNLPALTYILRDEFIGLLDGHEWNAADFERDHLDTFIKDYL